MDLIKKMKEMGIATTPDIEKAFAGDWISDFEADKKSKKLEELKAENQKLRDDSKKLEDELKSLKDSEEDAQGLKSKVEELTKTLEEERGKWAQKEENDRLTAQVGEFFKDKNFVNDITADAIKNSLITELQKDTAKGRSLSDIFDTIVKDENGEYKPNIMISEKDMLAEKNRAHIVGRNIAQQQGGSISMAELMKRKNKNPDMDIKPYLRQRQ